MADLSERKLVFLTTKGRRTGKPHCVELWFAVADGKVFLSHEGRHTDWMKNISRENAVIFRIGDVAFSGIARIVGEKQAFDYGKRVIYEKYYGAGSDDIVDDWFSESTIVEISSIVQEE